MIRKRESKKSDKREGLWDTFVDHGHEILLATSLLDSVLNKTISTKRQLMRAEENGEDTAASDALQQYIDEIHEISARMEDLDMIDPTWERKRYL